MKKFLFAILCISLISCRQHEKLLVRNEWIQDTFFINKYRWGTDTTKLLRHIKFLKNGDIYQDKYSLTSQYRIKKDSFYFVKKDSIISSFKIVKVNPKKIILETHIKQRTSDNHDTVAIYKIILKYSPPLPSKAYDSVLFKLSSFYNIGSPETLGNGDKFYDFDCKQEINYRYVYDNPYLIEPKIKGCIDRAIGSLPKDETLEKFSTWQNAIMNSYQWETLEFKLLMEDYYKRTSENIPYLKVKIWITEK